MNSEDDQEDPAPKARVARKVAVGAAVAGAAGVTGLLLLRSGGVSVPRVRFTGAKSPLKYQHLVRGHERTLSSGRTVLVRPHMRGPRAAAIKTTAYVQPEHLRSISAIDGVRFPIAEQFAATL